MYRVDATIGPVADDEHQHINRRSDLSAKRALRNTLGCHCGEHREPVERFSRAVRVNRRHRTRVTAAEALDMIQALSTGHAGSMSTIHANGPAESLDRLAMLAAMAPERVPESALGRQIASAVDVVVFVVRDGPDRRIDSIHSLTPDGFEEAYRCSS